jgi:hypothetical protein
MAKITAHTMTVAARSGAGRRLAMTDAEMAATKTEAGKVSDERAVKAAARRSGTVASNWVKGARKARNEN